ncbi:MAG: MoxR family ATPase [Lachnospiraceae bacterium]|nr:MoxR family ATPase [Lachnospiraceae bacterium]
MTIKEFGECLEFNIEHNIKHAILGLGAPGVGKSQLIRQIGKKHGYKVIDVRLAQMSEVEIGGLIYPNESRTKTVWLSPEILPDVERDGEKTILLLDEITSCTKRVQVAAYQLILDRRVGQYQLPEGCFVVALGNREDDEGVYIQLAAPLADRFEIHYIEPDFNSWLNDYAIPYGVHSYVVNYLRFKPTALHNQIPGEEAMVFATPRSWDRVSEILKYDSDVNNPVIANKIIGNIGLKEGAQFVEYCKKHASLVTPEEYVMGTKGAPTKPEELKLLVKGMISMVRDIEGVPNARELDADLREKLERVISKLVRFPNGEYAIIGLKKIVELNRPVVKEVFAELDDDEIMTFIKKNSYAVGLSEKTSGFPLPGIFHKQ